MYMFHVTLIIFMTPGVTWQSNLPKVGRGAKMLIIPGVDVRLLATVTAFGHSFGIRLNGRAAY
jgi:hypothetical protein